MPGSVSDSDVSAARKGRAVNGGGFLSRMGKVRAQYERNGHKLLLVIRGLCMRYMVTAKR